MKLFFKKKQTNSDRVFQQWLEFVHEDKEDAETWINPIFKSLLKR